MLCRLYLRPSYSVMVMGGARRPFLARSVGQPEPEPFLARSVAAFPGRAFRAQGLGVAIWRVCVCGESWGREGM
jgi:hypothetical protein